MESVEINKNAVIDVMEGREENYILPFLWLHGKGGSIIKEYMEKIYATGIKAVCLESRPHPDFAGNLWWQDVELVLEEARSRGMKVWILDDSHFPTGYANGRMRNAPYRLRRKFLFRRDYDVEGPLYNHRIFLGAQLEKDTMAWDLDKRSNRLVGAVMSRRQGTEDWGAATDLEEKVKGQWLTLNVAPGRHRISVFIEQTDGTNHSKDYINLLDRESVQYLIDEVYESHYQHFSEYFGNTLAGFFSDEPGFSNVTEKTGFSMDMAIGTEMPLPWDIAVEEEMRAVLGKHFLCELPLLWREEQGKERRVRYQYMNIITGRYQLNFSDLLGGWCEDHRVEYIGHIIEDNNAHARLGPGIGHYFRALHGQHMSGIDVVLQQIMPGFHDKHYNLLLDSAMDGEFYYFGLAKLGSSMAHLMKQTKGRAMCEIYGAYGWVEGLSLMKWLTDHMLVRGINVFVPHAFSEKEFPDLDHPPHFYARGFNPQYPYMKYLFSYINRVSHLLNGGRSAVKALILYHAELEWMGQCMLFQEIGRKLMENQIDYEVIPIDLLRSAESKNGYISINQSRYTCLFLPDAIAYPEEVSELVQRLLMDNVKVWQVKSPKFISKAYAAPNVSLTEVAALAAECGCLQIRLKHDMPGLRFYHYVRECEDLDIYMLFNESALYSVDNQIMIEAGKRIYEYNGFLNQLYRIRQNQGWIDIHLEPAESVILLSGPVEWEHYTEEKKKKKEQLLPQKALHYRISIADYRTLEEWKYLTDTEEFFDLFELIPDFSGAILYETEIDLELTDLLLEIPGASEVIEVKVNNKSAGVKISAPYVFDLSKLLQKGINQITIKNVTTLVYSQLDRFSRCTALPPLGIVEPITFWTYEIV